MYNQSKREELINKRMKLAKEAYYETNIIKEKELREQIAELEQQILIAEFGDKNIGRFNKF